MKGIAFVIGLIALVSASLFVYEANQNSEMPSGPTTATVTTVSSKTTTVTSPSVMVVPSLETVLIPRPDGSTRTVVTTTPGPSGPPGPQGPPGSPPPDDDDGVVGRLRDMLGL